MYWRLLSTDPEAAKDVVLAEKPVIADNSSALEPSLLQQLLHDLSTLASVRLCTINLLQRGQVHWCSASPACHWLYKHVKHANGR